MLLKRLPAQPDRTIVAVIQPGSLAEKCGKIKIGDRILAVNGVPVGPLSLEKVRELMGTSVKVSTIQ